MNNALESLFMIYYIISEGIFYRKLCGALKAAIPSSVDNINALRYLFYQVVIFTLDLVSLTLSGTYRIFIVADGNLPNYIYLETFSYAFTIFVMTGFGLSIPKLRGTSENHHSFTYQTEPEFINDPEKNSEYDCDMQVSTFGVIERKSFSKQIQDETSSDV
ncbi:2018_t:CDS:1 [Acaulospora colombiana]|uniref:2018_t:CDS:1 n=1 Tax=Acaulospora colombiana TaxID=27376 RepID=A0ACA9LUE7_9GLOM|nr:2018_t:CDS:1 [Acaulospora colombiana]